MSSEFVIGLFVGLVLGAILAWRLRRPPTPVLPPAPLPAPPTVIQASWQTGYAQGYEDATQQLAGEVERRVEAARFQTRRTVEQLAASASWTKAA